MRSEAPAYIMFTSGSTGEPKGVVITHRNLTSFLDWLVDEQGPREDDVFLNQVPYSFDVSIMDTFQALVAGATIFSVTHDEIANPRHLFGSLAASGLTVWVSTPSFAQLCLHEPRFDREMLPRVRKFLFCGEALPPEVAGQLLDRFPGAEVWNTYGPTEATVATTSIRIDRATLQAYSPLPIGRAMRGTRVEVLDAELRPVGPMERGEIVIAGPNVSPGYLHRPDLTARSFCILGGVPAYRTGDWGHHRDGLLFCDGRMDNQIKLHGHRVELGDVEANLRSLLVLAEGTGGSDFEAANRLRSLLAERVPAYMVPRRFRFFEALPMTINGKADRRELERLAT
jgi:D-alanine--poly(phosphoribitol) ligase subunit 1